MTPKQPRISIVTPSYNQAAFLRDTIESVLSQGYANLEYIVLDGGSKDGSVDIIREYEEQIDFWRSHSDDGQSAALVEGFAQADGEILAWVNSDDCLAPGALHAVAEVWQVHGGGVIVAGGCEYLRGTEPADIHFPTFQASFGAQAPLPQAWLFDIARHWTAGAFFCQPEVFFPAKAYHGVGGLNADLHFTMDYDLWARFAVAEVPVVVLDQVLAQFRVHPDQKTADRHDRYRELVALANEYLADPRCQVSTLRRLFLRAQNGLATNSAVRTVGNFARESFRRLS